MQKIITMMESKIEDCGGDIDDFNDDAGDNCNGDGELMVMDLVMVFDRLMTIKKQNSTSTIFTNH